ncbi:MAG: SIMPL domain-containing protein [Pseudomonadota bacterium]
MRKKTMRPWCKGLFALVAVALVAGFSMGSAMADDDARRITIRGSGTVTAEPDRATFSVGVVTEAATARDALDANTRDMQNLIDGLKAIGIRTEDLQTSSFSINPRYERSKARAPRIDGFEVRNTLLILITDLEKLGEVLDRATSLGANQFGRLSFSVSGADARLDEARAEAIADARRKAEIYVKAAGSTLKRVLSISEQGHSSGPRPMVAEMVRSSRASVPIETGETVLSVSVTVVWEIE